jgi:O-antigen/teichoic acid export membrane protein
LIRSEETTPVAPLPETPPEAGAERRERSLSATLATNTTLLVLGRVVVALSGLVGVGVATRYLGKNTFGELTVALAFVATLQALPDFGLWTVTTRELAKRPDEEQRIVSNALTLSIGLSAFAVLGGLLGMLLIYGGADQHLVRDGILIAGSPLLVAAPGGAAAAYMTAHQRAVPAALAGTLASILFVIVLLPAVALDLGFAGIAAAYGVSGLVTLLVPIFALRGSVRLRLGYDRALWRELLRWAGPQAGVLVLSILYFRFDTLLLSWISTNSQVALYGVAYKVVEVIPFLPFSFMITLFPEIARTEARSERLSTLAQGALSTMLIAAAGVVVLIGGFAAEIVVVVGGSGFHAAEPVVRLLAVAVGFVFLNMVFFQSLIALNRQRQLFVAVAAVFLLNVGLNIALIPSLGARGSAIALIASELLVLVLVARLYSQVGTVPRVQRPLRLLGAVAVMAAIAWLMHVVPPFDDAAPAVVLLVGGTITGAAYLAALHVLKALPDDLAAELRRLRGAVLAAMTRSSGEPGP